MISLNKIKERCEKATPGPWIKKYADRVCLSNDTDGSKSIVHCYNGEIDNQWINPDSNAEFIANARTDIPLLITEIENIRQVLEAYEQWEADMIADNKCWNTADGLPKFTQSIYDRFMELQEMRNKVLGRF